MGVIVLETVCTGAMFGPIPRGLMIADPAYLIANMTNDELPDMPLIKINILEASKPHRLVDWVPYLRSARHPDEQNMEMVRECSGDVFYRVLRPVPVGQELFVWFGDAFCREAGLPSSLTESLQRGDGEGFQCDLCPARFHYWFPLLSHMMYKCPAKCNNKSTPPFVEASLFRGVENKPNNPFIRPHPAANVANFLPADLLNSLAVGKCGQIPPALRSPFGLFLLPPTFSAASSHISPSSMGPLPSNSTVAPCRYLQEHSQQLTNVNTLSPNVLPSEPFLGPSLPSVPSLGDDLGGNSPSGHLPEPLEQVTPSPATSTSAGPPTGSPLWSSVAAGVLRENGNPMVHKLLQSILMGAPAEDSSSVKVAQNWCAECNTTFRMTSDLVYHMRTHHSHSHNNTKVTATSVIGKSSTAAWGKGLFASRNTNGLHHSEKMNANHAAGLASEDNSSSKKLVCEVCGDKFRERHHLSRHMSSHV